MKFWLPLTIFLTMVSPNLEAETIDPLSVPWQFDATLFNVALSTQQIDWSESLIHFDTVTERANGSIGLLGTFEFRADGNLFSTPSFEGVIKPDNSIVMVTQFPGTTTVFKGWVYEDFSFMSGRLDGIGRSDMTGGWGATPVGIPTAGFLMICALGSMVFFSRKPT